MKTFRFEIHKTRYIKVEADDIEEARIKAINEAEDLQGDDYVDDGVELS